MRALFHDRRFRLLFAAQAASMTGDSVMLIVLAIWMKDLTGSSGMAGAVMLTIAAPALLSPLLGWGVDRVRRKPLLVWTNVGSAVALLPLLAVHGRADFWIIYAVGAAYGVSFLLNSAGLAGLLKEVLPDGMLADANGLLRTVREGLRLVGPLAGAGVYAGLGAWSVVLADLVSFLAATGLLGAIAVREPRPKRVEPRWMDEASAGFRHLFGERVLRRTALAMAASILVFGTIESGAFAYVDDGLNRPAAFIGLLVSAMGVGSIVGGLLAPRTIRRITEPGTVSVGLAAMALGLAPLLYPNVALGLAAIPFAGFGVSFVVVAFATVMQRRTPQRLMGRVSTATDLLIGAPQTVSIAAGAVLVSIVDYRWIFGVAALGLSIVAAGLWRASATDPQPVAAQPVPTPDIAVG
jgi:Na+/melibiose symporter-like transporter